MCVIPNIPIENLLLADLTSRSYGAMLEHIGSAISCTPLFNKSFTELYNYICEDNRIRKINVYTLIYMNNTTFYNHIRNDSNRKQETIDICIASGFDLVLTLVLLSLKGFTLNPNDEYEYKLMKFICNFSGTVEERVDKYVDVFRPELYE